MGSSSEPVFFPRFSSQIIGTTFTFVGGHESHFPRTSSCCRQSAHISAQPTELHVEVFSPTVKSLLSAVIRHIVSFTKVHCSTLSRICLGSLWPLPGALDTAIHFCDYSNN